jgi:hypothetical protein
VGFANPDKTAGLLATPRSSGLTKQVNIASFYFFLFLVRPYSVDFASAGGRKLLAAGMFVRRGGDILPE